MINLDPHLAVYFLTFVILILLEVPIAYAMSYPERIPTGSEPLDLFRTGALTFEPGDPERFPALRLAVECLNAGGAACTVLNGANEEAVAAFLGGRIAFGDITHTVEYALEHCPGLPAETLDDIFQADAAARRAACAYLSGLKGA